MFTLWSIIEQSKIPLGTIENKVINLETVLLGFQKFKRHILEKCSSKKEEEEEEGGGKEGGKRKEEEKEKIEK